MTEPRLLIMALLPPAVRDALLEAVVRNGLDIRLGRAMFPPGNWHQTLSDRYPDHPLLRERLLRAGARVAAACCTLTLNRLRDHGGAEAGGVIHWAALAQGRPQTFEALLEAVRRALLDEGLAVGSGHSPHITLSYRAPARLGPTTMDPIDWTIDAIQLVVGGLGWPYHYEALGRWSLPAPRLVGARQLGLF